MRITHDSLTETTNPETPALLRLTSTPLTNVSVQVDERNGGLMTDPRNFWRCLLLKLRPRIRLRKIQKIQIRNRTGKAITVIMMKDEPTLVSDIRILNPTV